jgi:ABC-type sugar transport system ATPase subunit
MTEELLKLENIYKNFGNVKVLKDVNMSIKKGEIVALIGDNGAGKSTLIKVIAISKNFIEIFLLEEKLLTL